MKVYSYFVDVPQLTPLDEIELSILWRERWEAAGWEPYVLTEWHARKHPMFAEFDAVISALPTVNPQPYERACYLRWLALAQVGGGFMADLDVFLTGKGSMPLPADDGKLHIYQTPCCPSLAYASKAAAVRFCWEVVQAKDTFGNRPQDGRSHYSDQYFADSMVLAGVDWIAVHDVVKLYSDNGWEQAALLHFANAVMGGNGPKWKFIPTILKA